MKINRVSWRNYRNLRDGEIVCNGHNVTVSGRNGAGKSSIASVLPFVLFGKVSSKGFDEFGLTVTSQVPDAEVEFDDGRKLRRKITGDGKSHVYVDGLDTSTASFNSRVYQMTGGAGNLLFDPFEFPNMHWTKQRDFLLANFAEPEELPSAEELRSRLKSANAEVTELDARIKEIYEQLRDMPDDVVKDLDTKIQLAENEIARLQAARQLGDSELGLLKRRATDLRNKIAYYGRIRQDALNRRQQLLTKYRAVSTTCPTCGAQIPADRVKSAREAIVVDGKKAASQAEEAHMSLDKASAELDGVLAKISALEQPEFQTLDVEYATRITDLQRELGKLRYARTQIEQRAKLNARVTELDLRRRQVHVEIQDLNGELDTVNELRQKLIRKKEADVNSHFRFVTFKLFKILSTTGETRETCEAMIGGVPFANLSTGEKFKAACDILGALQVKFACEMPLMIDNAESLTPNSLLELPNQLFLFKVTDEDLTVTVNG